MSNYDHLKIKYPSCFDENFRGFECQEGWLPLIEEALQEISSQEENVKVFCFKEKFGMLRISLISGPESLYEKLSKIEDKSLEVCEQCGNKPANLRNNKGYLYTSCQDHIRR